MGAGVLFAMHLIMECSWNICIFHWVPAKRTVSHWRYELMIKWHRETWWCAKTMKTGGTRLWGSSLLVSCFYVCKDAHSERKYSSTICAPISLYMSLCADLSTQFCVFRFPFSVVTIFGMSALSLLPSFLVSFHPHWLPAGPFPFGWPNTVKHSDDNERSLVFPWHPLLYMLPCSALLPLWHLCFQLGTLLTSLEPLHLNLCNNKKKKREREREKEKYIIRKPPLGNLANMLWETGRWCRRRILCI